MSDQAPDKIVIYPAKDGRPDIRLRVEGLAGLVRDLTAMAPAALEAAA